MPQKSTLILSESAFHRKRHVQEALLDNPIRAIGPLLMPRIQTNAQTNLLSYIFLN